MRLSLSKDHTLLLLIVLAATFIRFLFLWAYRPEFVGWFNHTYYYYVQTRGVLTTGKLPYPDMPVLFYLYAFTAKLLGWIGIEANTAIVSATRFWMCIIPSLIPVPVYKIFKNIKKEKALGLPIWILTGASALLPLTVLHLPEFSQKNVLGLLLLAVVLYQVKRYLDELHPRRVIIVVLLFLFILLTHFGSTGAIFLYGFAIFIAFVVHQRRLQTILALAGIGVIGLGVVLGILYLVDPQRLTRVYFYLTASFSASFLGKAVAPGSDMNWRISGILGTLIPIGLLGMLWLFYHQVKKLLQESDQLYWSSLLLFCYLLVLPVYDQLLLARFILFIPLPLLIVAGYMFTYKDWKNWIKNGISLVIALGVTLLLFGEFMSLQMHDRDKDAIYKDIQEMQEMAHFDPNDLILTKNGAEHICNWFLGTKAGVITALNRKDFETYHKVYILNPIQGELNFNDLEGKKADNETDRYLFMMRNIPKPANAVTLYTSEHLELYLLPHPPAEWEYDEHGNWLSYGRK